MQIQSTSYKLTEFFLLFIALPVSLVLKYPIYLKIAAILIGFFYILWILLKVEKQRFKINKSLNWKLFWRRTLFLLCAIIILTIAYVYFTDASKLFIIVRTKPLIWIIILFIYSLFSVYPQELIYRTFFFLRYETLFKNKNLVVFINAIVFCLAHFFFKNSLVLILTFLGGILFALTFQKTRSTFLVSIEHAIYGSWLFTVGMGEMLGFPS
ncbi:CPBP family glutamic-type intramembrane protease [Kordia algicida OT-1]|uniref:Abortive infection protein n=1 Tax=Kordia algicida OT-1 TaxID=391587 RepID=A9EC30_9FLAO|nr:CPBP family intramembrane glutamic endopeptidase [Kordia algicida]EDP94430.1 Abortive infection protein [Kordia algicida OT-1]